jgi:ketosteroid isomerase-like protein
MQQAAARSSDEVAIRETVSGWSQAAGEKDLDKCVSFYADDASVLPFNAPIATGRDQSRKGWSQLMPTLCPSHATIAVGTCLVSSLGLLRARKEAWADAYRRTPHGSPWS